MLINAKNVVKFYMLEIKQKNIFYYGKIYYRS